MSVSPTISLSPDCTLSLVIPRFLLCSVNIFTHSCLVFSLYKFSIWPRTLSFSFPSPPVIFLWIHSSIHSFVEMFSHLSYLCLPVQMSHFHIPASLPLHLIYLFASTCYHFSSSLKCLSLVEQNGQRSTCCSCC